MARLFIFAGLPGSGKTTLARRLAEETNAVYLRIDTIEQGLRDAGLAGIEGEGYQLAYRLAADNLQLGLDVVADSCNPIERTRADWQAVAARCAAPFFNIEIVCSNEREHRRRVESRRPELREFQLPTWRDVVGREYHVFTRDRIVVDTADMSEAECMNRLLSAIELETTSDLTRVY